MFSKILINNSKNTKQNRLREMKFETSFSLKPNAHPQVSKGTVFPLQGDAFVKEILSLTKLAQKWTRMLNFCSFLMFLHEERED